MNDYVKRLIEDFREEFNVHPEYRASAMKYLFRTLTHLWAVSDDLDSDLDEIRIIALDAGLRPMEIEKTIRQFEMKIVQNGDSE